MKRNDAQESASLLFVWRLAHAIFLLSVLVLTYFGADHVRSNNSGRILSFPFWVSQFVFLASVFVLVGGFYLFSSRHLKKQGLRISRRKAKRASGLGACLVVFILVFSYLLLGDHDSLFVSTILVGLVVIPFAWWQAPTFLERVEDEGA